MKFSQAAITNTIALSFTIITGTDAFAPTSISRVQTLSPSHLRSGAWNIGSASQKSNPSRRTLDSYVATSTTGLAMTAESDEEMDNEIERLRSMAAQLRAEAANLEAERVQALADAAEKAFKEFDTNQDGEISLDELKAGLEKKFQTELSESRIRALMNAFDDSGDGALQLDEFVTIDKFRNKLESLAREEKALALEAAKQAKLEEEEAIKAALKMEMLNEKPPTNQDKIVSILPYLLPLLDGLQYGRFLILDIEKTQGDSPPLMALAVLYTLYRSIPFSGFLAFLAINFLTANTRINRLVRFNLQQSIFVDLALILPGLLTGVFAVLLPTLGVALPSNFAELGADAVFYLLLATLAYCSISSLLGITPDKIPFISQAVIDRMPTIDMFDENGRFVPRERRPREDGEDKNDNGSN
mmetsp:Transcript_8159/g.12133  ORF Transcript_8159/g.12133 Transcript_8159/m.12133 type:complete len:415 (-) Transcript_8159:441-1685(-)|eukprot:CAMPEP_0116010174 /NCGR_PEP_ID=MMETSP0321-20121206/3853_1 /TAXON_ID=163516 /ORGANISM="Leptocylindrus danicus var. danicus, Strain B650" /LENGTH=414 /DNA_ID=CAMNT_0003479241 /DNA_START=220 /DNA_END=1464 /DNA_ORIENTATION=-